MQLSNDDLVADRFRIGVAIGAGAMSDVYEAVDERLNRRVALKIFKATAEDQERFERESKLLIGISSPHVVGVLDAGEHEGLPYVVLDLYDGDLAASLEDGPLPSPEVAAIGADVARGLGAAHAAGVIHRDVKPSNVLLSDRGAVIADFGIARLADQTRMTQTAATIGTPAYLSPEQAAGEEVGPPADIYALGLVLLEALTGERPFPGSHQESLAARLLRSPEIPAELPARWQQLLGAMTAREPADRPLADTVAQALDGLAHEGVEDATSAMAISAMATSAMAAVAIEEPAVLRPVPHRSWVPAAAAIAVGLVMLGALFVALNDDNPETSQAPEIVSTTQPTAPPTTTRRVQATTPPTAPPATEPPVTEPEPPVTEATTPPTSPPDTEPPVEEQQGVDEADAEE